jgi:hypothetical protein
MKMSERTMADYTYRLYNTADPEERLEDAVMWKALSDVHGKDIISLNYGDAPIPGTVFFGRAYEKERFRGLVDALGLEPLRYWEDEAFLANCGRDFHFCDLDEAVERVDELHAQGKDAFVKSTRLKFYTSRAPVGTSLMDHFADGWGYTFMDLPPCLMIQEAVPMEFEQRFLFVEGELITSSPVQYKLTPAARLEKGHLFRTPTSLQPEHRPDLDLTEFAREVGRKAGFAAVGIDCAVNAETGQPLVIEYNPLQIGQMGLYACDPWALAEASKSPVFRTVLVPGERPEEAPEADEEWTEEQHAERVLGKIRDLLPLKS